MLHVVPPRAGATFRKGAVESELQEGEAAT